MQITIDTDNITERDRAILSSLLGVEAAQPKKAESAKVAEKILNSNKKDVNPDADAQAAAEDEKPSDGPTMEDAVAAATKFISKGEKEKVRAVLKSVGVEKVSELSEENIADFLAGLSA